MDANAWIWVALIAFLVFCCLPMLFMGRHGQHSGRSTTRDHRGSSDDRGRG